MSGRVANGRQTLHRLRRGAGRRGGGLGCSRGSPAPGRGCRAGGLRAARRRYVSPDQARHLGAGGSPLQGRAGAGAVRRGRSRHHNIVHNLAARWEACLVEVAEREEHLRELEAAHEARQAGSVDRDAWRALGADLERAWSHERATPQLRRNGLRAALVEITASVREDTVHLLLHWLGGDHTEIEVRRIRTGEHRYSSDKDVEDLVAGLARQLPDEQMARLLNRLGRRTSKGNSWNRDRVRAFRSRRGIPVYREGERQERGELSLREASARLDVDPSVVRRLIRAEILPARQVCTGAPWAIAVADLEIPRVVAALSGCRTLDGAKSEPGRVRVVTALRDHMTARPVACLRTSGRAVPGCSVPAKAERRIDLFKLGQVDGKEGVGRLRVRAVLEVHRHPFAARGLGFGCRRSDGRLRQSGPFRPNRRRVQGHRIPLTQEAK